ncbi:hypothetical protein V8G54_005641, partial [Vigna mungo]
RGLHRYFFSLPVSSKLSVFFCGSSFFSFSPLSATSRFSESLSVNHLSFKLRFLGLSFNSPRSKLRSISRKPGVFRNEIQVLLSKFACKILIPSPIFFFFFAF